MAVLSLTCRFCGASFEQAGRGGRPRSFCYEVECRRANDRERMRRFYVERPGYQQQYRDTKNRWHKAQGYSENRRKNDATRRARKRGAAVEEFTNAEVFDRDGWICGICSDPVPLVALWPHPMSVSLDHIVPLSRGGAHSRENTRCAHLGCNIRRGNRMEAA